MCRWRCEGLGNNWDKLNWILWNWCKWRKLRKVKGKKSNLVKRWCQVKLLRRSHDIYVFLNINSTECKIWVLFMLNEGILFKIEIFEESWKQARHITQGLSVLLDLVQFKIPSFQHNENLPKDTCAICKILDGGILNERNLFQTESRKQASLDVLSPIKG